MITEYSSKYADACIDIFVDNFTNPPFGYAWMRRENIARYFADMEKTPNFIGFVDINDQKLTGLCFGTVGNYFEFATYEIKEILVSRGLQGKGLGSVFLGQIEAVLKKSGIGAVTLNTNNDLPALNFYVKNGYGIAPKAVMMTKLL